MYAARSGTQGCKGILAINVFIADISVTNKHTIKSIYSRLMGMPPSDHSPAKLWSRDL